MNLPLAKNWNELITPSKLISENIDGNINAARITVEPLERGFATTLGNALRRVLLSSLQGGAITAVRVSGVEHEFSAIPGVTEDMVDVILNLKSLAVKMHVDERKKIWLRATGPCVVTAGMIDAGNDVEVLNPDYEICTLSDGASLEMELTCEMGKGYVPAGRARDEDLPIGVMLIDAVFSPVRKVSFKVENARVAQITDYDCLIMEVETNGTIDPGMAIAIAARILQKELQILITFEELEEEQEEEKDVLPFNHVLLKRIGDIEITVRSQNCLRNENIVYIGDLATKTENEMLKTPNFGRKSLNELKQILHRYGLTFGVKIPEWPPENCDELSKKYQEDRD